MVLRNWSLAFVWTTLILGRFPSALDSTECSAAAPHVPPGEQSFLQTLRVRGVAGQGSGQRIRTEAWVAGASDEVWPGWWQNASSVVEMHSALREAIGRGPMVQELAQMILVAITVAQEQLLAGARADAVEARTMLDVAFAEMTECASGLNPAAIFAANESYKATSEAHRSCRQAEGELSMSKEGLLAELNVTLSAQRVECERLEIISRKGTAMASEFRATPEDVEQERAFHMLREEYSLQKHQCEDARRASSDKELAISVAAGEWGRQRSECDGLQDKLDHDACSVAIEVRGQCVNYTNCYGSGMDKYNASVAAYKKKIDARKEEWAMSTQMGCVVAVLGNDTISVEDTDGDWLFERCRGIHQDIIPSELDPAIGSAPESERCGVIGELYPCTDAYVAKEYTGLPQQAPAKTCAPCGALVPFRRGASQSGNKSAADSSTEEIVESPALQAPSNKSDAPQEPAADSQEKAVRASAGDVEEVPALPVPLEAGEVNGGESVANSSLGDVEVAPTLPASPQTSSSPARESAADSQRGAPGANSSQGGVQVDSQEGATAAFPGPVGRSSSGDAEAAPALPIPFAASAPNGSEPEANSSIGNMESASALPAQPEASNATVRKPRAFPAANASAGDVQVKSREGTMPSLPTPIPRASAGDVELAPALSTPLAASAPNGSKSLANSSIGDVESAPALPAQQKASNTSAQGPEASPVAISSKGDVQVESPESAPASLPSAIARASAGDVELAPALPTPIAPSAPNGSKSLANSSIGDVESAPALPAQQKASNTSAQDQEASPVATSSKGGVQVESPEGPPALLPGAIARASAGDVEVAPGFPTPFAPSAPNGSKSLANSSIGDVESAPALPAQQKASNTSAQDPEGSPVAISSKGGVQIEFPESASAGDVEVTPVLPADSQVQGDEPSYFGPNASPSTGDVAAVPDLPGSAEVGNISAEEPASASQQISAKGVRAPANSSVGNASLSPSLQASLGAKAMRTAFELDDAADEELSAESLGSDVVVAEEMIGTIEGSEVPDVQLPSGSNITGEDTTKKTLPKAGGSTAGKSLVADPS